mmetsp:Transcript_106218/g.269834  ORF Transcript_106218/g.269834 Transcript_106218/m.269834 type:complete len:268 (-) Transcript_106218:160-963(-)
MPLKVASGFCALLALAVPSLGVEIHAAHDHTDSAEEVPGSVQCQSNSESADWCAFGAGLIPDESRCFAGINTGQNAYGSSCIAVKPGANDCKLLPGSVTGFYPFVTGNQLVWFSPSMFKLCCNCYQRKDGWNPPSTKPEPQECPEVCKYPKCKEYDVRDRPIQGGQAEALNKYGECEYRCSATDSYGTRFCGTGPFFERSGSVNCDNCASGGGSGGDRRRYGRGGGSGYTLLSASRHVAAADDEEEEAAMLQLTTEVDQHKPSSEEL